MEYVSGAVETDGIRWKLMELCMDLDGTSTEWHGTLCYHQNVMEHHGRF